jgi:hypothetical protein
VAEKSVNGVLASGSDFVGMNKFPYLWVVVENEIGRPVFAAAIIEANVRLIPLPSEILKLRRDLEIKVIRTIALAHYKQSGGSIPLFGAITGYVYARKLQENWKLTSNGEVLSFKAKPIRRVKYTLTLKGRPNRDITFLFRRGRQG